jgi:hypothetical protein
MVLFILGHVVSCKITASIHTSASALLLLWRKSSIFSTQLETKASGVYTKFQFTGWPVTVPSGENIFTHYASVATSNVQRSFDTTSEFRIFGYNI